MKPIKVSQLNSYIKRILQSDPLLGNVSVIGEISNLKHHSSGHVYFTMKDETGKINCFLPSDLLKNIRYELTDGMEITASGYIYVYERGGSYSLNVRDILISGTGNLSIAFEKLKEKLSKEGLFDEKYKKQLPFFPLNIGVVTSETGAAIKDILKIIKNRNSVVDVLIYPCLVQGPGAAAEIASAIENLNLKFPSLDLIIVGRGGGAMEELWAFNEEIVARSIFASNIPIISAVGHEIDVTIADFVSDKRAETPTAAAQIAVPDISELRNYIETLKLQFLRNLDSLIRYKEISIEKNNIRTLGMALAGRIDLNSLNAINLKNHMMVLIENKLNGYEVKLREEKALLESLNPGNIMAKGYAAITNAEGKLINGAEQLKVGEIFKATFAEGSAKCQVNELTLK